MLEEEGDVIREWNAMYEENFLSSWPREDLVDKQESRKKVKERVRGDKEKSLKDRRQGEEMERERRTRR